MISNFKYKWRLATGYYSKGFKYVPDHDSTGYREFYKSPERTLEEGGDCEDWCILVHERLELDGRDEGVTFEHWKNNDASKIGHMVLRLPTGKYISNHGHHGKTVRGYKFFKEITIEEVYRRIERDEEKPER